MCTVKPANFAMGIKESQRKFIMIFLQHDFNITSIPNTRARNKQPSGVNKSREPPKSPSILCVYTHRLQPALMHWSRSVMILTATLRDSFIIMIVHCCCVTAKNSKASSHRCTVCCIFSSSCSVPSQWRCPHTPAQIQDWLNSGVSSLAWFILTLNSLALAPSRTESFYNSLQTAKPSPL